MPILALYGESWTYAYKWRFAVIEDKDINAFSTPGGFVYVNTAFSTGSAPTMSWPAFWATR